MSKFKEYLNRARNYTEDQINMDLITKWNKPPGEPGREVTGNEIAFSVDNPTEGNKNKAFNDKMIALIKSEYLRAVQLKERMTVEQFFLTLYDKVKKWLIAELPKKKITLTMEDDYREAITKFGNSANGKLKSYPFYKIGIGAKEIYITYDNVDIYSLERTDLEFNIGFTNEFQKVLQVAYKSALD